MGRFFGVIWPAGEEYAERQALSEQRYEHHAVDDVLQEAAPGNSIRQAEHQCNGERTAQARKSEQGTPGGGNGTR
ncbi:MAG TPA: hypothetical protein VKB35_06880 [Ktedonobacteraceae bacterium]|nr:hypothetical protein [Ktedonobacteraceae bacterium]